MTVISAFTQPRCGLPYLHATVLLPAELDLAKLALANGVSKDVLAKLGVFFSFRMIVPTSGASSGILRLLRRPIGNNGRSSGIVILQAADMVWLG
jgi:hypothetical protein